MAIPKTNQRLLIISLMWGLPMILFATWVMLDRAMIEVEGEIIAKSTKCVQPYNNRCVTSYTLSMLSTNKKTIYRAASNDNSLSRDIPIGAVVNKIKWRLGYEVDGIYRLDFPIYFYPTIAGIGFMIFLAGPALYFMFIWEQSRKSRQS